MFLVTTLYSVFSFGVIGFEEIFTVWCSTDVLYGRYRNDMKYSDTHVWANGLKGAVSSGSTLFTFLFATSVIKPHCSNFRIITAILLGVQFLFYYFL